MNRKCLIVLWTFIFGMVGFAGCAKTDTSVDGPTGEASLALQSPAGDCVSGTIQVRDSSNAIVSEIVTDCTDASHEVILLPGDYTVTMADGYTCNPVGDPDTGYIGCMFDGSVPATFHVNVGATTQVALQFTFSYENADDESVLFTVGSVNITIDDPTVQELCGTDVCDPDLTVERCAILDGTGPQCWVICTTTNSSVINQGTCAVGELCMPVGTTAGTENDPVLLLYSVNSEVDMSDVLHLCVPGTAGTGGTGGTAGTGGSPATGGSLFTGGTSGSGGVATGGTSGSGGILGSGGNVLTGGTSGSGGVATGGLPATGGVILTGGTSGSGGVLATGGDTGTGGIATGGTAGTGGDIGTGGTVEPGASCTIEGMTITCTLDGCDLAGIMCVADNEGLFWGTCICLNDGTGGTSGSGGTAGTGGTATGGVATGGTSATGGTATGGTGGTTPFPVSCVAGQQVVRFDANDIVVGLTDTAYPGSDDIYFQGQRVSPGTWGDLCSDLDSDPFTLTCVTSMTSGTWQFQMYMPLDGAGIPGTPPDTIFWGDLNYSGASCPAQWGGDGSTLGTLTIAPCENQGSFYTITMVGNPTFANPNPATTCEAGEMLSYNGQITIP